MALMSSTENLIILRNIKDPHQSEEYFKSLFPDNLVRLGYLGPSGELTSLEDQVFKVSIEVDDIRYESLYTVDSNNSFKEMIQNWHIANKRYNSYEELEIALLEWHNLINQKHPDHTGTVQDLLQSTITKIEVENDELRAGIDNEKKMSLEEYLKDRISALIRVIATDYDLCDCSPPKGSGPTILARKEWDDHWENMIWNYDRYDMREPSEYDGQVKELLLKVLNSI